MAKGPKLVENTEPVYLDVQQGDRVRLLKPLWDGVQRYEVDEIIIWPFAYQPEDHQACLPEENIPELTAPAMGDGKPPPGYTDARTGRPLKIETA